MDIQCIKLNDYFLTLLRTSPDFSLVTEPSLALTVFRLTPQGLTAPVSNGHISAEALNDLNRAYYSRLSSRPDIMLTQTKLNDVFCIRFAIGAARTKKEHIDNAWTILQHEAEATISQWHQDRKD